MKDSIILNILNARKYLKSYTKKKYDSEGNTNFYLASYTKSVGYYLLKKIFNVKSKNFFDSLNCIISDIYFGINYSLKIIKKKKFQKFFFKDSFNLGISKGL